MEMPLAEALDIVRQEQAEHTTFTLNSSPGWSSAYRTAIDDYLSARPMAEYHNNTRLDPEAPHNRAAVYRLALRLVREGQENTLQMFARLNASLGLFNITQWHDNKVDTLLREHGLANRGYNSSTLIGVGVNMPAHPGLHNPPLGERQYDGRWQRVGNYTLRQITAREHLRGSFKPNQLVLRFPADFSAKLIDDITSLDLERQYGAGLKEKLADPDVRVGMKVLMRTQLNKVVDDYLEKIKAEKTYFSAG